MRKVIKRVSIAALAILAMSVGFYFFQTLQENSSEKLQLVKQQKIPGLLWPDPKQITDFQLVDHQGKTFDVSRLQGKWSLMFFGYSHCPDVCPATIGQLNTVIKTLKNDQQSTPQVIFVSVDPGRDTPEHLASYIKYFNDSFTAVTGNKESLQKLTKQLGILAMKVENDESADLNDYLMDHSASILLTNPKAQLVGIFPAPHDPEQIRSRYLQIRNFLENN